MAALWIGLVINTVIFWGEQRFAAPLCLPTVAFACVILVARVTRR